VKLVVVTSNPRGIASRFVARGNVEVASVLLADEQRPDLRRTLRKLRRVGPTAAPVGLALRRLYRAAGGDVPHLDELAVPVVRVPSPNDERARSELRRGDVAVALDCPLLSPETLAAARTVNVHHGAVPDYRGGPPVFWELAEGRDVVGFTVHVVDEGIDSGPVLAEGEVEIMLRPTLRETLRETLPRLHDASLDALEDVLRRGKLDGRPQLPGGTLRTTPPIRDYLRVRRRLSEVGR
jgi:hypothetical protein